MDNSQWSQRRAAAEAFSQSLDQLGVCFEPEDEAIAARPLPQLGTPNAGKTASLKAITLQALEDAAADIEQLFRQEK